jgi:hypothetical protein
LKLAVYLTGVSDRETVQGQPCVADETIENVWQSTKINQALKKLKTVVSPLSASLEELRAWIGGVVTTIDADMIHRILDETAYRWDICCVTRGNHIEHLCISVDKT